MGHQYRVREGMKVARIGKAMTRMRTKRMTPRKGTIPLNIVLKGTPEPAL